MAFERKYSDEIRQRSVTAVLERRRAEPENRSIIREVARELDVGEQSLRQWVARIDDGIYDYGDDRPGRRRERDAAAATGRRAQTEQTRARREQTGDAALVARIADLEQALGRVSEENEVLTRALAIMALKLQDRSDALPDGTPSDR